MPSKSAMPVPSEEAVRTRAYLMWEADGRPDGRSEHYWALASTAVLGDTPPANPRRTAVKADAAKPGKARRPKPGNGPVAKGKKKKEA